MVEAGDVLFVAVNIIRKYGIDAEQALKASNSKFERRVRQMESFAKDDGVKFESLPLDDKEAYWQRVKSAENQANSTSQR